VFQREDIINKTIPNEVFAEVSSIIHLAALIDISASVADPIQNHEVNVNGTFNMLNAAIKHKVKKFVFASSTAVYGDLKALPIKETSVLHPNFPLCCLKSCRRSIL
jgi:UDP-glucose 4-epimerase